jgi:hypothetical protein
MRPPTAAGRRPQHRQNVLRFVVDLLVREAQLRHPRGGVRLIAEAVPGLLGRRAVVAQPIGLDNEGKIGPVEVDLESVDPLFRQRQWQADLLGQGQKAAFQLVAGEPEGAPIEHGAE